MKNEIVKKLVKKILKMMPWTSIVEMGIDELDEFLAELVSKNEYKLDDAAHKHFMKTLRDLSADLKDNGVLDASNIDK